MASMADQKRTLDYARPEKGGRGPFKDWLLLGFWGLIFSIPVVIALTYFHFHQSVAGKIVVAAVFAAYIATAIKYGHRKV